MLMGGDRELDEGSLCVVARSFNTAHWRRLVQFPAGSRRGSIFLCLLYRVERGETNKECRRRRRQNPRAATHGGECRSKPAPTSHSRPSSTCGGPAPTHE